MLFRAQFVVVVLIGLLWGVRYPSVARGQAPNAPPPADLKVGDHAWLRSDAIEFGLTQLAKLIDYVFVAALAMLGLVVKTCVFDRMNIKATDAPVPLTEHERGSVIITIMFLAVSAIFGLLAYGYLPRLMTATAFSLNDSIGYFVLIQEVTCGMGMIGIGILCYLRLK